MLDWLSVLSNDGWLVVIDNVDREDNQKDRDEQAYSVMKMLPHADHGSELITSRLASTGRLGASLSLGHVHEARKILKQGIGADLPGMMLFDVCLAKGWLAEYHIDAHVLIGQLKRLPLALTKAGAHLRMTQISVEEYVQYYDETWAELIISQDRYPLQECAERNVLTIRLMSYQQEKRQSASAASLLKLWSLLSRDRSWHENITAAPRVDIREEVPAWLMQMASSKLKVADTIKVLSAYTLIPEIAGK